MGGAAVDHSTVWDLFVQGEGYFAEGCGWRDLLLVDCEERALIRARADDGLAILDGELAMRRGVREGMRERLR